MYVIPSTQDPQIGAMINGGAIAILPTDTSYCLIASALLPAAVAQVYALAGHDREPGVLLCSTTDYLVALGFDKAVLEAASKYWPNPLDVLVPVPENLKYLDFGAGSMPVRIPGGEILTAILDTAGPVLAVSANPAGQPPANSLQAAQQYFGDQVDFYVGGSDRSNSLPATLAKMNGDQLEIIQPGAVSFDAAGNVVGAPVPPPSAPAQAAPEAAPAQPAASSAPITMTEDTTSTIPRADTVIRPDNAAIAQPPSATPPEPPAGSGSMTGSGNIPL